MNNTILNTAPAPNSVPSNQVPAAIERECESDSHLLLALGVVLLVCGGAITGHHEVTMIGLGMIIFSSLFR
jgi:hypothetical protein